MAAANILNKQSRTADKSWYSSLELGEVLITPHRKNLPCYRIFKIDLFSGAFWRKR